MSDREDLIRVLGLTEAALADLRARYERLRKAAEEVSLDAHMPDPRMKHYEVGAPEIDALRAALSEEKP